MVAVKGRGRPTRVYALLGLLGDDPDQLDRLEQQHKVFLDAYRRQQWDNAERALAGCREIGVVQLETYYALLRRPSRLADGIA
jgi:hypothetical protein